MAPSIPASVRLEQWNREREYHESLFGHNANMSQRSSSKCVIQTEEIRTVPVFSAEVLEKASTFEEGEETSTREKTLTQYGLLAKIEGSKPEESATAHGVDAGIQEGGNLLSGNEQTVHLDDRRLFININAPWSAFICGSQGTYL